MARRVVDGPTTSASSANSATGSEDSVTSTSISVGGALVSMERRAVSMPPARTFASDQPRCATARLTVSRVTSSSTQAMKLTAPLDLKSTRLNSSHTVISYAVFCLKQKQKNQT